MHFDGEYRFIGKSDPAPLREIVGALPEEVWYRQQGRQEVFAAHRRTQSIPLIFDPDMRHESPTVHAEFARFGDALAPVMRTVAAYYAPDGEGQAKGYFVRALLTRLDAGGSIGSHRDHGYSLSRAHRVHFPLITNALAEFGIAGHIRHLPAGELWEINNRRVHGVRNPGDAPRVHLILDYVIPGEPIEDPEGWIIA